ncbi:hypothetical protein H7I41_09395 [Mycobacterium manitobense]|uniref:Uncharacterized protein n=1 Tax=[Mycobacterium] manitobense TaxID=190147 RepID=A0A9X3BM70_9MYCO|nr:hypothetical protein [[Mycobacterium] manitobense]MCV7170129.1 hypothetical protein [[Mycobacterium] manitobense]
MAVGIVLVGASIGLAAPAAAEPLNGAYSGTLIDGAGTVLNPDPIRMTFAPCGPDCTRLTTPSQNVELHLQGGAWVAGYTWNGAPCTITVNGTGSILDDVCPNEQPMRMALTKNG